MDARRCQSTSQADNVRQEQYCRQAMEISRFCYNMAVATHRFHRVRPAQMAILARYLQGLQRLQACWTTPSLRKLLAVSPRVPSWTSAKPSTTGETQSSRPEHPGSSAGSSPAPAHSGPPAESNRSDTTASAGSNSPVWSPSSWTAPCPRVSIMTPASGTRTASGICASNYGESPSPSRRTTTGGPAPSTLGSTPWAPTQTARNTRTPGQPTKWRRDFADGRRPRPGDREAHEAGGKPSGGSNDATFLIELGTLAQRWRTR